MSRVIVVSGGGTGIGRAIAPTLAGQGDRVVILGRRRDVLESTAKDIEAATGAGRVTAYAVDAADPDCVEEMAQWGRSEHGTIDAVVNNAGGSTAPGPGLAEIAGAWRRTYDQNVLTAVLVTSALGPLLRRPGGRVVLIGPTSRPTRGSPQRATVPGWTQTRSSKRKRRAPSRRRS